MNPKTVAAIIISSALLSLNCGADEPGWLTKQRDGYTLFYTPQDEVNTQDYSQLIDSGINEVSAFFDASYPDVFGVYIHPDRHSLNSAWQHDWGMPEFKSECWMVASGVANKLDMISPKQWDTEACEHVYSETTKTQQLVSHELVHVYHGQLNASPDFSDVEGIDWFVEGLATYVSGQCDASRIAEVKSAIGNNDIPDTLENFWTGRNRYGLSGSVVMYIDHRYGRSRLAELLPLSTMSEILSVLQTSEPELLEGWKGYIQTL